MEIQKCLGLLDGLILKHIGFEYLPHNPDIISRFLPECEKTSELTLIGRDQGRGLFMIWNDPEKLNPVIYFFSPQHFGAVCSRWQEFMRLIVDGVMLYELALDDEYLVFSEYPGQDSFPPALTPEQIKAFHHSQASRLWNQCSGQAIKDLKAFLHDKQRTAHHFGVWLKKNSREQ